MRIFLDTNILLDLVISGRPSTIDSLTTMQIINRCRYEVYVSTQSIIDFNFTAHRYKKSKEDIDHLIEWLLNNANVRPIDCFSLRIALNSGHPDFEDSAQLACAEDEECDVFLTSDAGILAREVDTMLVMTPGQFLDRMR